MTIYWNLVTHSGGLSGEYYGNRLFEGLEDMCMNFEEFNRKFEEKIASNSEFK